MSFVRRVLFLMLVGVTVVAATWLLMRAGRKQPQDMAQQCAAAQDALTLELPGAALHCAPDEEGTGRVLVSVSLPVRPAGLTAEKTRQKVEALVKFRVPNVLAVDLTVSGVPVP